MQYYALRVHIYFYHSVICHICFILDYELKDHWIKLPTTVPVACINRLIFAFFALRLDLVAEKNDSPTVFFQSKKTLRFSLSFKLNSYQLFSPSGLSPTVRHSIKCLHIYIIISVPQEPLDQAIMYNSYGMDPMLYLRSEGQ